MDYGCCNQATALVSDPEPSIRQTLYSVALPFFRKGKDKPPSSAQQPAKAVADDAPITETLLTMDMGASGIVVEETSGAPQS